jgi:uncharacterized ferritin-like protein (DUF455 family)
MFKLPKNICSFAKDVLYGNNLELKLIAPEGVLSDPGTGSVDSNGLVNIDRQVPKPPKFEAPLFPGRPENLSFVRPQKSGRTNFPGRAHLADDRARGLVLHFFANHELLALELMALALLKWPDAPDGFRRGLVQTMIEEQNHMRLYLGRMQDLKVEFGEAPLNAFFWNSMKDLSSPMEFAAAMAMTFEQANLDFALHYEGLFRVEGDVVTADIMRRVRLEEIGHIKHGVVWFERWRPKCERLFKEWQEQLQWPMTPARAKGMIFDREGRLSAGLPVEYIDELEVHNQSKGRPPRVFWFNPGCEQEVEAGDLSWTPPKAIQALTSDYASLMGFLGHKSDIVLLDQIPSVPFLKSLDRLGFEIPEFILQKNLKTLVTRKFTRLEPWGWSPISRNFFVPLVSRVIGQNVEADRTPPTAASSIFSKSVAADMRVRFSLNDVVTLRVKSREELDNALATLRPASPWDTVVFKAPFSASGRGMIRLKNGVMAEKDWTWIKSNIDQHGFVLAEAWLDKWVDLSAHIDISQDGVIKFIGFTRFLTDQRGQYQGHILGRQFDDLGAEFLKRWHAKNGWQQTLQETVINVGHEAFRLGYTGPLGIDALIYRSGEELRLRPLLEINPRWSMGRIALAIAPRLAPKRCGLWRHVSLNEAKKMGHKNFSELVSTLDQRHPSQIETHGSMKTITQGVFCLNDPETAKQSVALLIVGHDLAECSSVITS